jgi:hypothetical protein
MRDEILNHFKETHIISSLTVRATLLRPSWFLTLCRGLSIVELATSIYVIVPAILAYPPKLQFSMYFIICYAY